MHLSGPSPHVVLGRLVGDGQYVTWGGSSASEVVAGQTSTSDSVDAVDAVDSAGPLVHVERLPERVADPVPWPTWTDPLLVGALQAAGVSAAWRHQREVAEHAHAGRHVVVATGTASGKSLGYHLPLISDLLAGAAAPNGRGATALYLSPTKALAEDQLARLTAFALPGLRPATYDGDTPTDERRWIRDHANLVLTNPDLLHHSLLPGHEHWAPFLRALKYVVIDECHAYRGVFGAHVSAVVRRLRRVCARYRSEPVFICASATVADPAGHAERLVGVPFEAVTTDGSPRAAVTVALWEPPMEQDVDGLPKRVSTITETSRLLAGLVAQDVQTVAFARSRAGVEVVARAARERLPVSLADSVVAYRGGYLPEERREIERAVRSGAVRGVAATNALELGVDIHGLDAVVLAGWPGTHASFWQQVGRAGRSGQEALAVFVAADDPLDSFLMSHPATIFARPAEATVLDPANSYVLAPHLAAAAAELAVTEADESYFGPTMPAVLATLVAGGVLRRRPRGWYWAREDRAADHVQLRGIGEPVRIMDARTGRVVGTVDEAASHAQVHTGAVHVHQGQTWVVTELDLADRVAHAVAGDPGWSTQARSTSEFDIISTLRCASIGPLEYSFGVVTVREQVTSFLRRLPGGEVIGEHALDLPERTLTTRAVWWTAPEEVLVAAGIEAPAIPGALHAAEHAAIGMLPFVATADRWDIGGVSTALHPDTGLPTVMVYDGYPGGAGFAERGYEQFQHWQSVTLDAVQHCSCARGCPSCVQSPKCGNGNEPLDKAGAVAALSLLVRPRQV